MIAKEEVIHYTVDKTYDNAVIIAMNEEVVMYGNERIGMESDAERIIYVTGLNESVTALISKNTVGERVESIGYDDLGNSNDVKKGFGYNGEKLDESGNIYLRARYYNPRIGQFVQIDRYRGESNDVESQNRYLYCLNNPYKYVDRDGKAVINAEELGGGSNSKSKSSSSNGNSIKGLAGVVAGTVLAQTAKVVVKIVAKALAKQNKEVEPCPEVEWGADRYYTLQNYIYNYNGDGRETAKRLAGIDKYAGEARRLIMNAADIFREIRKIAIQEDYSQYRSVMNSISGYPTKGIYREEFITRVSSYGESIYNRIVSNTDPYVETYKWVSNGNWAKIHPHKDSDAYGFYESNFYKKSMAFGELGEMVLPLANGVLVTSVIYERYINTNSSIYDAEGSPIQYLLGIKELDQKGYTPGKGYDSYKDFKKENSVQTKGNHWHHVVEQCQEQKSGFSVQQINNTNNMIELTPTQHGQVSGFYSSIQPFSEGMKVRDWLAGQSFEAQYQFGIDKLTELGFIK